MSIIRADFVFYKWGSFTTYIVLKRIFLKIFIKCLIFKEEGVPTSIDFINNEKSWVVTSFESTHHNIYDLETSKVICKLDYSDSSASKYSLFIDNYQISKEYKDLNYFLNSRHILL